MSNETTYASLPRAGCPDIWNAFMVKNARFTLGSDIPFCPCTCIELPTRLISFEDAKHIYKEQHKEHPHFFEDAFVHFYIDDQKFDGKQSSIWLYPEKALSVIGHFAGAITPDFSTNADFPDSIKRFNTYRMRTFGTWLASHDIPVINNVRWGSEETWDYCFDGIPQNSIVSIGTVASGIHHCENRPLFESGLKKMVELLRPTTIIVYGSSNYSCFKSLEERGIHLLTFPSQTSLAFSKGGGANVKA